MKLFTKRFRVYNFGIGSFSIDTYSKYSLVDIFKNSLTEGSSSTTYILPLPNINQYKQCINYVKQMNFIYIYWNFSAKKYYRNSCKKYYNFLIASAKRVSICFTCELSLLGTSPLASIKLFHFGLVFTLCRICTRQ